MQRREGITAVGGNPLVILGEELALGAKAPDVTLVGNDNSPVSLSSLMGAKATVLLSFPSIDTSVCDMEVRRFNEEAAGLDDGVSVVGVSMDLPSAQKRWCGAAGVDRVTLLSDHREAAFGEAYGVLVEGLRLLARTVFVLDAEGTVRYTTITEDFGVQPDYDAVLEAVRAVL